MITKSATIDIKNSGQGVGGIAKLVIIGAMGVIAIALAIKMIKNSKKMSTSNQAVNDPNVSMAMQLNSAIHPSRSWVGNIFTGANKDEIFRLAQYIKDFDVIAQEYQNLYDESLSLELQDALGDQYPDLLAKLGRVKTGTDSLSDEELAKIAEDLYKDMNGFNWTSRNLQPYSSLLRLTDVDFKKTIEMFNSSHSEGFRDMLEGESGTSVLFSNAQYLDFTDLKDKVLARYDKLY
jgi:hypothetical protein